MLKKALFPLFMAGFLAIGAAQLVSAKANSACIDDCYYDYDQCVIATDYHPSCFSAFRACTRACNS